MQEHRYIINEILEHTKDCDYNRHQHFYDYRHYNKISRFLSAGQMISLILIVLLHFVSFNIDNEQKIMNIAVLCLSLISMIFQLTDYLWGFSSLAQQHYLAAQAYSRLYRQCQFFPSHYGINCNISIAREVARSICNELFDLNLTTPHLSQKSYEDACDYLRNKIYPMHSEVTYHKSEDLSPIVNKIINELNQYQIEIVCFGSYIHSLHSNDIDIAIIIRSDISDDHDLNDKILDIERYFHKQGIKIDLTLITPNTLQLISQYPFIRNIQQGRCIYISCGLDSSIGQCTCNLAGSQNLIDTYYQEFVSSVISKDENSIINKSYYYIRHLIIYNLLKNNKEWHNEDEMLDKLVDMAEKNDVLSQIEKSYRKLKKLKNIEFSIGIDKFLSPDDLKSIIDAIHTIHSSIQS